MSDIYRWDVSRNKTIAHDIQSDNCIVQSILDIKKTYFENSTPNFKDGPFPLRVAL